MRNRKRIYVSISMLSLLILVLGINVIAASSDAGFFRAWGGLMSAKPKLMQSEEIYAEGIRSVITNRDIEQAQNFYILSGMDEVSAENQAIDYVMKRDALYQSAIESGYSVTDQEVWDYIEELEDIINHADNREDAQNVMNQFESEEAYWEYEFTVYQINLPIQNYVHDLEQEFKNNAVYSEKMASEGAENAWQQYFESLKESLVMQQNYELSYCCRIGCENDIC